MFNLVKIGGLLMSIYEWLLGTENVNLKIKNKKKKEE